jgi:SAM-dependent methyltransferase
VPPTDRDINLANWNAWANVHGQDSYYDSASLIAGRDSLTDIEWAGVTEAIGAVAGRDILHVQCHLAFDGITLARRGARVTGVDFSAAALAKAHDLAGLCKVPLDLVEADVTDLPASLHGRFDLAYATIGILCWISDVGLWMRSVAGTLRPGGTLLLVDGHPFGGMIGGDPPTFQFPYANDGPHHYESGGSYAAEVVTENVQYAHAIGEIVTAAADAGLRIRKLTEHLDTPIEVAGFGTPKHDDGRFRRLLGGHPVPLLYTLIADRPA